MAHFLTATDTSVHHNPTPGPASEKYVYGHNWVTLAALLQHPDEGARALPLRSALYVRAKDVTPELVAQGWQFRTKLELAAEQLQWLHTWAGHTVGSFCVVADGAYAKRPLLRRVRQLGMTMVSRLPKNAALWSLPRCDQIVVWNRAAHSGKCREVPWIRCNGQATHRGGRLDDASRLRLADETAHGAGRGQDTGREFAIDQASHRTR